MTKSHSIPYRPEIDGLRALAVVPVLLFHAGFGFPGGFAGVDVFFVISGYLIGSGIIREAEAGDFSFVRFWARRLRRLLPAWAVVVLAVAIASPFVLIPKHLAEFGESLIYQPILAANIYFWRQTGYFETASDFQPLLHTWSLALEEQFYVILPLVLLPLIRIGRRATSLVVVSFLLVSLGLSIYFSPRSPGFAFFMLPARIWELNIGLLIVLLPEWKSLPRRGREIFSWAGLSLILAGYFLFDQNTNFPGSAAALPCLGTALLLATNRRSATAPGSILSLPFLTWIGKISYPLYLWHWPILVFVRYLWIEEPPIEILVGALLACTVLAWATWRWVEQPVRSKTILPTLKPLSVVAIALSVFFLAGGLLFQKMDGFPNRFSAEVNRLMNGEHSGIELHSSNRPVYGISQWAGEGGPCSLGEVTNPSARIVVWGDSHASALFHVLDDLGKEHRVEVILAFEAGVAPIPGTYPAKRGKKALEPSAKVLRWLDNNEFDGVLFVAKWPMYIFGRNDGKLDRLLNTTENKADRPEEGAEVFVDEFSALIKTLEAKEEDLWVMRTVAFQPRSVPETLAQINSRGLDLNSMALPAEVHRKKDARINQLIDRALEGTSAIALDPYPSLIDENGLYLMAKNQNGLYSDDNHLSQYGAHQLREMLTPVFKKVAEKQN